MKIILNFKDKDTFKRLERQTYDGTLDVSDFPPAEYKYFSELRKIYYAFKFEGLTKVDAEKQKAVLFCNYQKDLQEHEDRLAVYRDYQNNIKISEMLKTDIQKSRDIRDIALTAVQVVGLLTHDECFIKTNATKLKEL